MTKIIPFVKPVTTKLECSACGASGEGSCNCGAPYISPGARAAKAIADNPEKSNRTIAAEIGVSHQTIMRAREGGPNGPPEKVTGRDGKSYPATVERQELEESEHYCPNVRPFPKAAEAVIALVETLKPLNRAKVIRKLHRLYDENGEKK